MILNVTLTCIISTYSIKQIVTLNKKKLLYYKKMEKLIFVDDNITLWIAFSTKTWQCLFKPLFNLPLYGKLQFTKKISCIKIAARVA